MRFLSAIAAATLFCISSGASAGVFTDDMSKCLVAKSTAEDQTALMEWLFSVMAAHPAVRPLANISDAQRNSLTAQAAAIMVRLVTIDCRSQTVAALRYEGPSAFGDGFKVLGQVAVHGLMKDPSVDQGFQRLKNFADEAKLHALFQEAGLPPSQTK